MLTYLALLFAVVLTRGLLIGSTWHSTSELHTLLEVVSALLSVIVGASAMIRFYARKTSPLLLAGVGFCGAAFLDSVHMAITSSYGLGPDWFSGSLVTWTWFLGRFFLGAFLAGRAWLWAYRPDSPVREFPVFTIAAVLSILFVVVIAIVPLPDMDQHARVFSRPQELLPAVLLAYAVVMHLRIGAWKDDPFEHSLIISMILAFAGQALFMPFSAVAHDAMFDGAHLLKLASKGVVLIGLFVGTSRLFRVAELDQEQRTFGFLENLPVGVFIVNAKGQPYYANKHALNLLGQGLDPRATQKTIGTVYQAYVIGSEQEYPSDRMPIVRALKGEFVTVADMEIRKKDVSIPLEVSGAPIVDKNGKIMYGLATFQDIRALRRIALEDPLTGLANRLALQEAFGRMAGFCWRTSQPICAALIDLDRFKHVNDSYGHDMGDKVLRRAAAVIGKSIRTSDLAGRWGGEEIAVLLPGVTLAQAVYAVERALTAMQTEQFEFESNTFSVTFSAGVVTVEKGFSLEQAIALADRPLYEAKQEGRNRVYAMPRD